VGRPKVGYSLLLKDSRSHAAPLTHRLLCAAVCACRYLPDISAYGELLPAAKPLDFGFFSRASAAYLASLPAAEADEVRYSMMTAYTQQEVLLPKHMHVTAATTLPPTRTCVSDLRPAVYSGRLRFAPVESVPLADADAIIWCTGYRAALPFFSDAVLAQLALCDVKLVQPLLLHGAVWPPASLPNLAFVGMYRGAFVGLMELQARWACMAFAGVRGLTQPKAKERKAGIDAERRMRDTHQCGQSLLWQYVGLCEFLAEQIGVRPRTDAAVQATDPELHRLLLHGAFLPASYRLQGFAANPKQARAEMLRVQKEQDERRQQHESLCRQRQ
jgi:dimethylaniline monooxygenase (N-oxide forming)